jgi:hypothetical protein
MPRRALLAVVTLTLTVAGCDDQTGLRLHLLLPRAPAIDAVTIRGAVDGDEAFAPATAPDPPRPLGTREQLVLLLPEGLDGDRLALDVDGLDGDEVVVSGAAGVVVTRASVVDVDVRLDALDGEGEGEGDVGEGEGEGEGEGKGGAVTVLDDSDARCDDGDACAYSCADGHCDVRGEGDGSSVDVVCAAGSDCHVHCIDVAGADDRCAVTCLTGASCRLECRRATSCALLCAPGADCRVDRCEESNGGGGDSCGPSPLP